MASQNGVCVVAVRTVQLGPGRFAGFGPGSDVSVYRERCMAHVWAMLEVVKVLLPTCMLVAVVLTAHARYLKNKGIGK